MKIDKGIPLPKPGRGPGRPSIYNWSDMVKDDSVFIDGYPKASDCPAYTSAKAWGKRNGVRFESLKEGTGIRIWRVS